MIVFTRVKALNLRSELGHSRNALYLITERGSLLRSGCGASWVLPIVQKLIQLWEGIQIFIQLLWRDFFWKEVFMKLRVICSDCLLEFGCSRVISMFNCVFVVMFRKNGRHSRIKNIPWQFLLSFLLNSLRNREVCYLAIIFLIVIKWSSKAFLEQLIRLSYRRLLESFIWRSKSSKSNKSIDGANWEILTLEAQKGLQRCRGKLGRLCERAQRVWMALTKIA